MVPDVRDMEFVVRTISVSIHIDFEYFNLFRYRNNCYSHLLISKRQRGDFHGASNSSAFHDLHRGILPIASGIKADAQSDKLIAPAMDRALQTLDGRLLVLIFRNAHNTSVR